MLPAACLKGVHKEAALAGHSYFVGGKQKQHTSNLSARASEFYWFLQCWVPTAGSRIQKTCWGTAKLRDESGIWNVSNRWTFVSQKILVADKFYDGISQVWCIQVQNGVHVHSINHYVYLIVLRTTITVVLSNNNNKKNPTLYGCWVCSSIFCYNCSPVGFVGHMDVSCSNLDEKRLLKSRSCRRNSKNKIKWEIKWRKRLLQNKNRNKGGNIREKD